MLLSEFNNKSKQLNLNMSLVKSRLKAARDCLAKKDYFNAKDAASKALEHEPDNYTA